MISFVKEHKLVLLSVAVGCCIGWYFFGGYAVGYLQANADIVLGKPKYIGLGLPVYPDSMFAQILADEYAVRFKRIAGCVVTPYQVDYADAYNGVVIGFLAKKYHRNIWEDVNKKLSRLRRESRATKAP
jgi:hypothetical protein